MKKFLCILFLFLFCFLTSCSINNNYSKQTEIIDKGTYYCIYKDNTSKIRYDIYNLEGDVVLSEKADRPLEIKMINEDIIDIKTGIGTGISLHRYYSVSHNIFSQDFSYVLSDCDNLIAYIGIPKENPMKKRKVIVQNIFDKNMFHREFELDFSRVDMPVIDAVFSNDAKTLKITYLTGEKQKQVSTTLDLT